MPTKKIRINLTVDDDLNSLLDEISNLTNMPKATFVLNILKESQPALKELLNALKLVEQKKNALPSLYNLASSANEQTAFINNQMADLLKQIDWVEGQSAND